MPTSTNSRRRRRQRPDQWDRLQQPGRAPGQHQPAREQRRAGAERRAEREHAERNAATAGRKAVDDERGSCRDQRCSRRGPPRPSRQKAPEVGGQPAGDRRHRPERDAGHDQIATVGRISQPAAWHSGEGKDHGKSRALQKVDLEIRQRRSARIGSTTRLMTSRSVKETSSARHSTMTAYQPARSGDARRPVQPVVVDRFVLHGAPSALQPRAKARGGKRERRLAEQPLQARKNAAHASRNEGLPEQTACTGAALPCRRVAAHSGSQPMACACRLWM